MRKALRIANLLGALFLTAVAGTAGAACPPRDPALAKQLNFTPDTASPEARAVFDAMAAMFAAGGPNAGPPPKTVDDWDRANAGFAAFVTQMDAPKLAAFPQTARDDVINGVKVVWVSAPASAADGRVIIDVHGGGYTMGTARSSLLDAVLLSDATGLPVVSVDYTTAPRGTWQTATAQVVAVYSGLLKAGHAPAQIGMSGGSAGGGLVGGSVFRMRDEGLPLPGALVLMSPWSDITDTGDSYCTLANADPILTYESLKAGADLYAAPQDQKNPYVSPVYGDYGKGYPPMLIQGGTREIFLSNFVRQYQAATSAGQTAVLDLYEGMPHGFQAIAAGTPESKTAYVRAAAFFATHLQSSSQ